MTMSVDTRLDSERLERNAECQRIARLLGIGDDEISYLAAVPSEELRTLREQITAGLFDNQGGLAGIAAATKILPAGLVTSLAQKVFGPLLVARIAGLVDPDRAVELARDLPVEFLADVAVELDPRRVAAILAKIPPATVGAVTKLLIAREEWVAMGSFYAYLPEPSIRAALAVADPLALLRIALVLDGKQRLNWVFDVAGAATVTEMRAAAAEHGLSAQLDALGAWLTPEHRAALEI